MKPKSHQYVISALITLAAVIYWPTSGTVAAPQQSKQNKDEQELTALVKQMAEAQAKFDPAALDKIYTPDFIEISPLGEVDPRDKVLGFYKPEAKPPADVTPTMTSDEFLIRSYDNFAVVIARFTYALAGNGPATRPPFSIRVTVVCRKEKGVWKIASSQYTGIRPPRPPA